MAREDEGETGDPGKCPDCGGTGERAVYLDSGAFVRYECFTCRGTGRLGSEGSGGDARDL